MKTIPLVLCALWLLAGCETMNLVNIQSQPAERRPRRTGSVEKIIQHPDAEGMRKAYPDLMREMLLIIQEHERP